MQTNYKGTVMLGSSSLQTSIANAEIIASEDTVFNFTFMNDQSCNVLVNGVNIYLRAEQGLFVAVVNSFKVVNANITYNWVGVKG